MANRKQMGIIDGKVHYLVRLYTDDDEMIGTSWVEAEVFDTYEEAEEYNEERDREEFEQQKHG